MYRFLRTPASVAKAHRTEVLTLYRDILRAGSQLPDSVAAAYVHWRANQVFHRRQQEADYDRVLGYLKDARRVRRVLRKATGGDRDSFVQVLELAYGARGRLKHAFKVACPLLRVCVLCVVGGVSRRAAWVCKACLRNGGWGGACGFGTCVLYRRLSPPPSFSTHWTQL